MSEEGLFYKARRLDIADDKPADIKVKLDTELDPSSCKHMQVIHKDNRFDLRIEFIRSFTNSAFGDIKQIQPRDFIPFKYWSVNTQQYKTLHTYSNQGYLLNDNWVIFPIILIKDTNSEINWTIPRFIVFNHISDVSNIKTELDNYNYDDVYIFNNDKYYYLKNDYDLEECIVTVVNHLPTTGITNSFTDIYICDNIQYIRIYDKWIKLQNINDIINIGGFTSNTKQEYDLIYNRHVVTNYLTSENQIKFKYLYNLDNSTMEVRDENIIDSTKFKQIVLLPQAPYLRPDIIHWYYPEDFPDISTVTIGQCYGVYTHDNEYTNLYLAININGIDQFYELSSSATYFIPTVSNNILYYSSRFEVSNDISQGIIETHGYFKIKYDQDNPYLYFNYDIDFENININDLYELDYYATSRIMSDSYYNECPITYLIINNLETNKDYKLSFLGSMDYINDDARIAYNIQTITINIPEDVNFNSIYIDGNIPKAFQIPYDNEYIYSMIPSQVLKMTVQPAIHKAISDDVLHTAIKYSNISKTNDLPNDYWDLTSNSKDLELDESPSYSVAPSFPTACDIVISNLKNKNYDIPSINFKFDYYVDITENDVPYEMCRNNTVSTSIYSYNPYRILKNTINNLNGSRVIDYGVIIEKVFFGSTNKPIDLTVTNPDSGCIALEEFLNTRILSKLLLNNNGYGNTHMNKFKLYLEINGTGFETTVRNGTVIFSSTLKMTHAYMDSPIQIGQNTYYGLEIILQYDDGSTQYQLQAYAAINSNDPSVKYQSLAKTNPYNCVIGVKGNSTLPFNNMQIKLVPYELYNSTLSMSLYMTFLINSNIKKYINDEIDEEVDRGAGLIGDLFDLPDDLSELDLDDLTFTSNYVNLVLVRANGRREFISEQFVIATDPSTGDKYLSLYVGSDENSDPDEEYAYYSVNLYITSDNGSCKLYIKSEYFNQNYPRGNDPIDFIEFNDQYGNPTTVTITINDRG